MGHRYFVYIPTNERHTVTNDLVRRVSEHREHKVAGFTSRYNVDKLVFYQETNDNRGAIATEKQIKAGYGPRRSF